LKTSSFYEIKDKYDRDGVVVVSDIIPLDLVLRAIEESNKLYRIAGLEPNVKEVFWRLQGSKKYLEKFEQVIYRSTSFSEIAYYPKLMELIKVLLNDSGQPSLFKDKLIYKAPGQDGYPLHQDFNWWHGYSAEDICTAVIPFDDISERNGGIEFFLGCHKECFLPEGENRALSEEEEKKLDEYESIIISMKPGDVLIFHSLAPHFSSRNMSDTWRRQLYPTYCSSKIGDVYTKQIETQRIKEKSRKDGNIYAY
jgi:ectoine hydroxylase-related dioxygenase (phytanoyl-CoA dioxygenase family)